MNIETSIKGAFESAEKREMLCKNAKPCPACGTKQVQLKEWIDEVVWKCRKCKHIW